MLDGLSEVKFLPRSLNSALAARTRIVWHIQGTNEFYHGCEHFQAKQQPVQGFIKPDFSPCGWRGLTPA